MTFGKRPQQEKGLDGRTIHKLWLELGTINKVQRKLLGEGYISPRTGKGYTNTALIMSAWRWCIWNPKESFEVTKTFREAHGETLTMSDWYGELIVHARTALTPNGYLKFLQGNQLEDRVKRSRK